MKSLGTNIRRLAAAAFLLLAVAPCAPAQGDDADDERKGCEGLAEIERARCEDESVAPEFALLLAEVTGQDSYSDESRLRVAQIGKDLDYLRAVTGQLSRLASQSGELDLKAVAQLTLEVRNRAARLKENLTLPRPEEPAARRGEEVTLDAAQLRAALSTLSALISEVVRNPVLKGYVLDMPRAAGAQIKLEEIVALSARIWASSKPSDTNRR